MTKPKTRITDIDVKPPRLIDSTDIAGDVERFLAAGGKIDRPEFRRDRCEVGEPRDNSTTRRRWQINQMPPELREFQQRGGSKK
jgi:hypothetical protein